MAIDAALYMKADPEPAVAVSTARGQTGPFCAAGGELFRDREVAPHGNPS